MTEKDIKIDSGEWSSGCGAIVGAEEACEGVGATKNCTNR
mgnify:CR=1 FL=1